MARRLGYRERAVTDNATPVGADATPEDAKLVGGVWLPSEETHLVEMMLHHPQVSVMREGKATYQIHKLDACLSLLPGSRRRTAVDVGAHVGLWSMWLAKAFGTLHAFEPYDRLAALFRLNVPDDNVTLHPVALGAGPGTCAIAPDAHSSGDTFVRPGEGDVPIHTLDSYGLNDVDFIKIDVEGLELAVAQGARETLLRCRPLVCVEQKGKDRTNFGDAPQIRTQTALSYLVSIGMTPKYEVSGDFILDWE